MGLQPHKNGSSAKPSQAWSQERIIEAIKARHHNHLGLNAQAVALEDSRLIAAGRRLFGCWKNALLAAGIEPDSVRPSVARRPRGTWSRDVVITEIKRHAIKTHQLNAYAMQQVDNPLMSAATYYFGSWADALRAAGIDAESVRRNQPRDPQQIVAEIQDNARTSESLRDFEVRAHNRALYGAAQKYFGSWHQAVREAHCEHQAKAPNFRWSRADIHAIVATYLQKDSSLGQAMQHHTHLKDAIIREWGSWETFEEYYQNTFGHPLIRSFEDSRQRYPRVIAPSLRDGGPDGLRDV